MSSRDEVLTWDQNPFIAVAAAAGVAEPHLVHVAGAETISKRAPAWGPGLWAQSALGLLRRPRSQTRRLDEVLGLDPFAEGARQVIDWFDVKPDRQVVDEGVAKAFRHPGRAIRLSTSARRCRARSAGGR